MRREDSPALSVFCPGSGEERSDSAVIGHCRGQARTLSTWSIRCLSSRIGAAVPDRHREGDSSETHSSPDRSHLRVGPPLRVARRRRGSPPSWSASRWGSSSPPAKPPWPPSRPRPRSLSSCRYHPVRLGLVASLARPGGNATGFATENDELPGKRMELVKETIANVSRVAAFFQPTYDGGIQLKALEVAARSLHVRLQTLQAEALIVSSSSLFYTHKARLVEFTAKRRFTRCPLPTRVHRGLRRPHVLWAGLSRSGPSSHRRCWRGRIR